MFIPRNAAFDGPTKTTLCSLQITGGQIESTANPPNTPMQILIPMIGVYNDSARQAPVPPLAAMANLPQDSSE